MRFAASLLVLCVSSLLPAAEKIPVVSTWEQLEKQKPIDLGGGMKIRLGIEAAKAPQHRGVLIYCLVEGLKQTSEWKSDRLGPVTLKVYQRKGLRRVKELAEMMKLAAQKAKTPLYARTIAIPRRGTYFVEVRTIKGKLLAETTITAEKPVPPWTTLCPSRKKLEALQADGRPPEVHLEIEGFAAVPDWEGSTIIEKPLRRTKEGTPLPTMFPREESKDLQLKRTGSDFLLQSDVPLQASLTDDVMLARWWVNGKPWNGAERPLEAISFAGRLNYSKSLRLILPIDAKRLGAKPGDKIGLQLLSCPSGINRTGSKAALEKMLRELRKQPGISRMSNRVEWIVPKP